MNALEQLISYGKQLDSVNETLKSDMQEWERKEYLAVKMGYEEKIKELEFHIETHKEIFEELIQMQVEMENCKDLRYFYNTYWTVDGKKVNPVSEKEWNEALKIITFFKPSTIS